MLIFLDIINYSYISAINISILYSLIMDKKPACCPLCGARTEWITEFMNASYVQIHTCLDIHCCYGFLVKE